LRIFPLPLTPPSAEFSHLILLSTLNTHRPGSRAKAVGVFKALAIAVVVLLVLRGSPVESSEIRIATLGGESRFLLDDTNLAAFPARAVDFPHASFEIFDEWAGLVIPVGKTRFAGLFFNRPTPEVIALNRYAESNGSRLFRQLEVVPWVDLMYASSLGDRLKIGLAGRVSYDVIEVDSRRASARQSDLRAGLLIGAAGGLQIDAAIGIQRQDLRDTDASGGALGETDGTGLNGDVRLLLPLGERFQLIQFVGIESGSYALAPSRRDHLAIELGIGLNFRPAPDILLIGGVVVAGQNLDQTDPGVPVFQEDILTLPAVHVAAEAQQGSMIFRLGMNHSTELLDRQEAPPGTPSRSLESHFDIQLGLGLEFGAVLLDGHLERDFLRDGPDFVGGSRHGGGILSKVTVTHRMGY
jgi:hypothetical protein